LNFLESLDFYDLIIFPFRFIRGEVDAVSDICPSSLMGYPMPFKRHPTPQPHRKPSSDSGQSSIGYGGSMDLLSPHQAKNRHFIPGGSMMPASAY
jgi:hypothetical protein